MINGNVLKFGYDDISVGSDGLTQRIKFRQFKPPAKCGDEVSEEVEYIGEEIAIKISYNEYCEFSKQLKEISDRNISTFDFKGYIFDFSNYNEESVKACNIHLNGAIQFYFLCMAA